MTDLTERVARALAQADGLNWGEPCGVETEADECDSGTCIAALHEDHDPAYARGWYLKHAQAAIAAMQADAVPVAWMPIVDQPITSSAVDDSETGNTTDKLRSAVEVWLHHSGYEGNADVEQAVREFAAVIEADRAQCLAALQAQADALAGALACVMDDSHSYESEGYARQDANVKLRAYEEFRRG